MSIKDQKIKNSTFFFHQSIAFSKDNCKEVDFNGAEIRRKLIILPFFGVKPL